MKRCPTCKQEKPIEEFNSQGKYCKVCHRDRNRQWRENNREKDLESKRKSNKKHSWNTKAPSVRKKSKQLGMPLGTAANRLRRNLMWSFAVKCGESDCFRCGELIASPEEMSIDHVEDWLDSEDPVGLFFDVENLRLSHKACNRPRLR